MFKRPRNVKQHEAHAVKSLLAHPGWAIFEREVAYMVDGMAEKVMNGTLEHDDYVRYTAGHRAVIDVLGMANSVRDQAKESNV